MEKLAQHNMDIMEELLKNTSDNATNLEFIELVHEVTTRNIGTQCGKLSKST